MFNKNNGKFTLNGKVYDIGEGKKFDDLNELSSAIDSFWEDIFKGDDSTPAGRLNNMFMQIEKMKLEAMEVFYPLIENAIVDRLIEIRLQGLGEMKKRGVKVIYEPDRFRVLGVEDGADPSDPFNYKTIYESRIGAYPPSSWERAKEKIEEGLKTLRLLGVAEEELQPIRQEIEKIARW